VVFGCGGVEGAATGIERHGGMYLKSVANYDKTFAPVKAASSTIAFYQKINLFIYEPTQSPAVYIVRSVATSRFGLKTVNRKEPFY
jgi:hypothetical protein